MFLYTDYPIFSVFQQALCQLHRWRGRANSGARWNGSSAASSKASFSICKDGNGNRGARSGTAARWPFPRRRPIVARPRRRQMDPEPGGVPTDGPIVRLRSRQPDAACLGSGRVGRLPIRRNPRWAILASSPRVQGETGWYISCIMLAHSLYNDGDKSTQGGRA